ncbi:MAG: class I SAM-dependent methyltransferase [Bdellovibrionales bacterium]|nr:class I SAM-dependent methyltransferase [Bdellovibrionales bacterium]
MIEPIQVFSSDCRQYKTAFEVFLRCTNQKTTAFNLLHPLVKNLPHHGRLLDVGAGDGTLTGMLAPYFEDTLALEPNAELGEKLRRRCPGVNILPKRIDDVHMNLHADLILCSHVLYYIDRSKWMAVLDKLASWLAPGGTLVCVLQNPSTDCMRMVEYLYQDHFDLSSLAQRFDIFAGHRYRQDLRTLPSMIEAPDEDTAYTIAEFVLNVVPMREPVPRDLLLDHVNRFFRGPDGLYRFSCDQDFLVIQHRR